MLLAGAALAYVLGYRERSHPVAATVQTATQPPPFAVSGAAAQPSSYAATLTWTTPQPSTARLQWGPAGAVPVLWTTEPALTTRHVVRLTALEALSTYDATIVASSMDGASATATVTFRTAQAPATPHGTIRGGTLLVDGNPFFPLIAWKQCREQIEPSLTAGIDLFAGSQCLAPPDLVSMLAGRAVAAGSDTDPVSNDPGVVGWFYPDEADIRGYTADTLPALPPGLRFLTVTGHFFSGSAPLANGPQVYPGLVGAADVVGFDLYPLQELCRPDLLPWVFDAQRELMLLAPDKPTFQWIEARAMRCGNGGELTITPATIRAESWLAVAAGARGLAYFPPDWALGANAAISGVAHRIRQLEPALLQPVLPVTVDGSTAVRASARSYDAALYVIAVNGGYAPTDVRLTLPQLGDRPLLVPGSAERLTAQDGVITDRLPPLGVRIYVAPPA